jgi:hypothetical protein
MADAAVDVATDSLSASDAAVAEGSSDALPASSDVSTDAFDE